MTDTHAPIQEDPQQLRQAIAFWQNFMGKAKWMIIAIAVLLIALAAAFVPFSS
ncbi:MAG: hypothetical protein KDI46_00360 [Alphaproteobacteria bacterium]|nr:hypothetical protein [Alphaproteobacteria bacterium]